MHRVFVCQTCSTGQGPAMLDALRSRLGDGLEVVGHDCLNLCDTPQALAFRARGKAAYLFGDLTLDDLDDAVVFAQMWRDTGDGWIEDARPAGRLRFCLKGRIPG